MTTPCRERAGRWGCGGLSGGRSCWGCHVPTLARTACVALFTLIIFLAFRIAPNHTFFAERAAGPDRELERLQ